MNEGAQRNKTEIRSTSAPPMGGRVHRTSLERGRRRPKDWETSIAKDKAWGITAHTQSVRRYPASTGKFADNFEADQKEKDRINHDHILWKQS